MKITYLIVGSGVSATLPHWETFVMKHKIRKSFTLECEAKVLRTNTIQIVFNQIHNHFNTNGLDNSLLTDLQELINQEILNPFFVSVCKRINDEQFVESLDLDCQTSMYDVYVPEPKVPLFDEGDVVRVKYWSTGFYGLPVITSINNFPENEEITYNIKARYFEGTVRESEIFSPIVTQMELSNIGKTFIFGMAS